MPLMEKKDPHDEAFIAILLGLILATILLLVSWLLGEDLVALLVVAGSAFFLVVWLLARFLAATAELFRGDRDR